ncbi:MAG: hypothetical protein V3V01_02025, partial [Acidimicrobiales bacterium]
QLEKALDRHDDLFLANWTSVSGGVGLTFDAIHLNGPGRRLMAGLVLDRVADARAQPAAGRIQRVAVSEPSRDAVGVVIAVSVTEPRLESRVTVTGCGAGSTSIRLAPVKRGEATSQVLAVPLDHLGRVCLRSDDPAHIEVKLLALIANSQGTVFSPKSRPGACALPSNPTNQRRCISIAVPDSASAQLLFVRTRSDRIRSGRCDRPLPVSSQLSASAGELVLVQPDELGELCWSSGDVKVTPVMSSVAGIRAVELATLFEGRPLEVAAGDPVRIPTPQIDGEIPIVRIRIRAKTAGALRVGRCGRPGRSATVLRFDRKLRASTTVFGFANHDLCIISSVDAKLTADVVGYASREMVRTVLPRRIYSTG